MICFLVGADDADPRISRVQAEIEALGYTPALVPTLARLRADPRLSETGRSLILVFDRGDAALDVDPEAILALTANIGEGSFLVLVSDAVPPDFYKRLIRTDRGEWIAWSSCIEELHHVAARLKAGAATGSSERAANVVSFLPSRGGVGTTTLAVETGIYLASRRAAQGSGRIAILDLNLQGGTLADALDLEPRLDVAELIGRPERLDEHLIDVFSSRHSPQLDLFAGPISQLAPDALPPSILFSLIDAIGRRYETILLDLPPYWMPWIDNILQGSDAVVAVGGSTVPAMRHLISHLKHLNTLGLPADRIAAAVNFCQTDLLGRLAQKQEIARALTGRRSFYIRRNVAAASAAQNGGRSLLEQSPGATVSRDIKRLAAWVAATTGSTDA